MKKYQTSFALALGILLCVLLAACTDGELVLAMADFDRAYVPAVSLTADHSKGAEAVMAVKRLIQNWGVLEVRARTAGVTNEEIESIDSRLREVDGLVMIRGYDRAHAMLLEIGPLMRRIRQRYGISYYLDYLAAYNEAMGKVEGELQQSSRVNADHVTRQLALARTALDRLREQKLNAQTFWLSRQSKKEIITLLEQEHTLLGDMDRSLAQQNLIALSEGLEASARHRQTIFRMFGNFAWADL